MATAGGPIAANAASAAAVLPKGTALSDHELSQFEGAAAPMPAWAQQFQQACMATPYAAAGCGIISAVLLAGAYVLGDKLQQEIDREVTPLWEQLITSPLKNCGPWGWRCW
jgi:hypothetical protein